MAELVSKLSFKIQVGTAILVVSSIVYWVLWGGNYVFAINQNTKDITENTKEIRLIDKRFDKLATKEDLQIFKQDIKDFIK